MLKTSTFYPPVYMSRVVDLDSSSFDSTLRRTKKVFVDFWAPWCGPCARMNPLVERIAGKHDEMLFAKVNIEKDGALATRFHISSLPAFMVFSNAQPSQSKLGTLSERELEQFVSGKL